VCDVVFHHVLAFDKQLAAGGASIAGAVIDGTKVETELLRLNVFLPTLKGELALSEGGHPRPVVVRAIKVCDHCRVPGLRFQSNTLPDASTLVVRTSPANERFVTSYGESTECVSSNRVVFIGDAGVRDDSGSMLGGELNRVADTISRIDARSKRACC
jgi:hypothetical protein